MIGRALLAALVLAACSSGKAERAGATPAAAASTAAPATSTAASAAPAAPANPATAPAAAATAASPTTATPAATAAAATAAAATAAPVEPLSDEDGAELFATACTSCHTSGFIAGSRISEKGWTGEVAKMRKWGALVDEETAPAFAAWLARKYPAAEPAPADPIMTPAAALATVAASPDRGPRGDPAHGKEVFAQACASCHGQGALGTGGGPSLVENPALGQGERFALLVHGGKGRMPGYDDLKPQDIASLRAYLRGLSAAR